MPLAQLSLEGYRKAFFEDETKDVITEQELNCHYLVYSVTGQTERFSVKQTMKWSLKGT